MKSSITFHGGAGTVTGANFLLDTGTARILIDCGTTEQEHVCDSKDFAPFPYDLKTIDALIVSHAHADHIGRIPKLVRDGFEGPIFSTYATKDIAAIMFDDALRIMQEKVDREGCDMLYERIDVEKALSLWRMQNYHEAFSVADLSIELFDAGHILGSALVRISREGRHIFFTGDLGNTPEPLLRDTEKPEGANYIVMESVYGDRVHEQRSERKEMLRQAVEDARERGGTLLIPSFSVERTQILLYELNSMIEDGSMQKIPVYMDSPLARRVTDVFRRYKEMLNPEARGRFERGDDPFTFSGLSVVEHTGDSRMIHAKADPKIIIAGAGMSGGGRVRAHEKEYLNHKNATILFVGYQAPGSLGRRIQDGENHVEIDGERIRVRANIATLTGYSGHADRDQLLSFVEGAGQSLKKVFVVMGEPKASLFLAQRLHDFLDVDAVVPKKAETIEIDL